ncbi:MAG: hypothetical protein WKF40_04350 [Thermoleophilaceae bacterium]
MWHGGGRPPRGRPPDWSRATLYLLAESIFAYIDEISAESIEGYTFEQAAAAGERQRRRRRLTALLIQDPPADQAAVEAEASAAGWALPRELAALVTEGEDPDRLALRLGADVIATAAPPGLCALVPDPDGPGRRLELESAVGERRRRSGPTVPWHEAATSAERARAAARLASEGVLDAAPAGWPLPRTTRWRCYCTSDAAPELRATSAETAPCGTTARRSTGREPRAAGRYAARLAAPPGRAPTNESPTALHASADGALPAHPAARPLRRRPRGPRRPLRARAGAAQRRAVQRAGIAAVRLDNIRLLTPNSKPRCLRFYSEVLLLPVLHGDEESRYVELGAGEASLALFDAQAMEGAMGPGSVQPAAGELRRAGAPRGQPRRYGGRAALPRGGGVRAGGAQGVGHPHRAPARSGRQAGGALRGAGARGALDRGQAIRIVPA